jgi:phage-related protein
VSAETPVHWIGSSKKDFLGFPQAAVSDMGYALGVAQLGGKHPSAKPWKGEGPGVFEIVEDHSGDTFRLLYTVRFAEAIYVLHAFQKKSRKGIATAAADVSLIGQRLKLAQDAHRAALAKKG